MVLEELTESLAQCYIESYGQVSILGTHTGLSKVEFTKVFTLQKMV